MLPRNLKGLEIRHGIFFGGGGGGGRGKIFGRGIFGGVLMEALGISWV